jgi:predicted metal-binding membrane protein
MLLVLVTIRKTDRVEASGFVKASCALICLEAPIPVAFAASGLWQLTPLKGVCLRHAARC